VVKESSSYAVKATMRNMIGIGHTTTTIMDIMRMLAKLAIKGQLSVWLVTGLGMNDGRGTMKVVKAIQRRLEVI
jgi:hypothetical protein